MAKLFWFLLPTAHGTFDVPAWWDASAGWIAPPGVTRWLRSEGVIRTTSLLAPGAASRGSTVASEEFWVEDGSISDLRDALLDREAGLASLLPPTVDLDASALLVTDEIPVLDGPRTVGEGRTVMALYVRKNGQSREESQSHWKTIHADMVRRHGGITHYIQCPVIDPEADVDGIPIIYFADAATEAAFLANEKNLAEQFVDSQSFIDHNLSRRFYFEDRQIEQLA